MEFVLGREEKPAFFSFSHNIFKIFYKGVKSLDCVVKCVATTTQTRVLTILKETDFENFVGKSANAGNQHISSFHKVLYPIIDQFHQLCHI